MSDPELLSVKPYSQREREMADEIERLTAELANANNSFGCQTANWPGLAGRIEDLKQLSNERWRDNERLQARVEELAGVLLKCTMNHDEAHYIAQMALDTIAAAEQEGK